MKKTLLALAVVASLSSSLTVVAEDLEITITADKVQFLYDVKDFTVKPGQKVKIVTDR